MYKEPQNQGNTAEEPVYLFPNEVSIKPFLKWAGGKTQLLSELHKHIPVHYGKYLEPFIGGGAMYFSLNPNEAIISDANEDLVLTYQQLKTNVEAVIEELRTFQHDEDHYYSVRGLNPASLQDSRRAARLIFLNKTCFNGLYRVNKKGEFNVPYGGGAGSFLNEVQLRGASDFLQSTTIVHGDYLQVLREYAAPKDFIFLDPPYYPVGKYGDFKRYTKEFFYHDDQVRLKKEFDRLVNLGCNVILTNSDHEVVLDLYSDYEIRIIETRRMISSNPKTRTGKDIIVVARND